MKYTRALTHTHDGGEVRYEMSCDAESRGRTYMHDEHNWNYPPSPLSNIYFFQSHSINSFVSIVRKRVLLLKHAIAHADMARGIAREKSEEENSNLVMMHGSYLLVLKNSSTLSARIYPISYNCHTLHCTLACFIRQLFLIQFRKFPLSLSHSYGVCRLASLRHWLDTRRQTTKLSVCWGAIYMCVWMWHVCAVWFDYHEDDFPFFSLTLCLSLSFSRMCENGEGWISGRRAKVNLCEIFTD